MEQSSFTIPARPTGYSYLGWIAGGTGCASASGVSTSFSAGESHFSGQVTTFDASYSLNGPGVHILAECTAVGAYRMMGFDMQQLQNSILKLDRVPTDDGPDDPWLAFESFIAGFVPNSTNDRFTVPDAVCKAVERLEQEGGNGRICDLCRELQINERTLHRSFLKVVGLSPKAFATIQQVLGALRHLQESPTANISSVAVDAGFTDQSHLSNVFRQYLRVTPAKVHLSDDGVLSSLVAGDVGGADDSGSDGDNALGGETDRTV
ncbi:MAG: helix-turn-helix domain-containing protein [Pseudomonadota bacterium]